MSEKKAVWWQWLKKNESRGKNCITLYRHKSFVGQLKIDAGVVSYKGLKNMANDSVWRIVITVNQNTQRIRIWLKQKKKSLSFIILKKKNPL